MTRKPTGLQRRPWARLGWFSGFAVALIAGTPGQAAGQIDRGLVTFTKHIAPILQRSCERCHRPGGGAPMALVSYEGVRPWARAIMQKTGRREMPPWFIEKGVGIQKFKDDLSLSDEEIALIATWVDNGGPKGNPADMPPPRQWPDGQWTIGTPDLIVSSAPTVVQAVAPDFYGPMGQTPLGLNEDRYVKAVQVREVWLKETPAQRPANRRAGDLSRLLVHHAHITAVAGAKSAPVAEAASPENRSDFYIVYEVGQNAMIYPDQVGVLLRAGQSLAFPDIHLHSIGQEVSVRIDVGFKFHPKDYKPKYVQPATLLTMQGPNGDLDIPAGQQDVRMDGFYKVTQPTMLLTFEPHLHASGKRMCAEAIYPNGHREVLNCSRYNHNWVNAYVYEDDVAPLLPTGTMIWLTAWYDNSPANPRVVDPRNWKGYGRRSIDDMFYLLPRAVRLTEEEYQAEVAEREAKRRRLTSTNP